MTSHGRAYAWIVLLFAVAGCMASARTIVVHPSGSGGADAESIRNLVERVGAEHGYAYDPYVNYPVALPDDATALAIFSRTVKGKLSRVTVFLHSDHSIQIVSVDYDESEGVSAASRAFLAELELELEQSLPGFQIDSTDSTYCAPQP